MTAPRRRSRQSRRLGAGPFEADIAPFRLHLAAEGKAARTVQGYTRAVRWFAAGHLRSQTGKTSWEQANGQDVQRWIVQLLGRYSSAYASIQFRVLRQFFKWLAAEAELPDPMARLRAPAVAVREVPVLTSVELSELDKTCQGTSFRTGSGTTSATPGSTAAEPKRDLMELNGWTSPQMLTRYGASARSARARRTYDRIMDHSP